MENAGWFQTHEFKREAAEAILEQKQKKYDARLVPATNGRFTVQYRAYSDEQIKAQKEAKKASKSRGA